MHPQPPGTPLRAGTPACKPRGFPANYSKQPHPWFRTHVHSFPISHSKQTTTVHDAYACFPSRSVKATVWVVKHEVQHTHVFFLDRSPASRGHASREPPRDRKSCLQRMEVLPTAHTGPRKSCHHWDGTLGNLVLFCRTLGTPTTTGACRTPSTMRRAWGPMIAGCDPPALR